ncbi:NfeD family protein [Arhodomonas sp. AD133]|uniref:NfeD family protein n=1 Tax=Arhodomonas sp. AD133 TaxID=3415009 RepID=UPI003EB87011
MRAPVALRYVLIQVPEALLVAIVLYVVVSAGWVDGWVGGGIFGLWLLKDAALYPLYRHALRDDVPTGVAALVGRQAVTLEPLDPTGHVRVDGERWRARTVERATVGAGEEVRIVAAEGFVLIVEAAGLGWAGNAGN